MNIKLVTMDIENFKNIKKLHVVFEDATRITGCNGSGKTSVYDSFLWLLFGKDSFGRKDFDLVPLDENGGPQKGLVVSVEAQISFDGITHALKKCQEENVVKGQLRGYTTICTIDEAPKKIGEYNSWIADQISEDSFKLLTDLHYFNEKLHWTERRSTLLDMAGEIGTPKGFDNLLSKLNNRSIEEYKKVLAEQKKAINEKRDQINPRIDEIQKGLDENSGVEKPKLEARRIALQKDLDKLDAQRKSLLSQEQERQKKIERINTLKGNLITREAELKSDTSGVTNLLNGKTEIETGIARKRHALADIQSKIVQQEQEIRAAQQLLAGSMRLLEHVRKEYVAAQEAAEPGTCYACGQALPEEKLAELAEKKKSTMADIAERGNKEKSVVKKWQEKIAELDTELYGLKESAEKAKIEVAEGEQYRIEQFAKIDAILKNRPAPVFSKDKAWWEISQELGSLQTDLGEPLSEQLEGIESSRKTISEQIAEINSTLAQADRIKRDKARISELENEEIKLAQQVNDIDRLIADIEEYKRQESALITDAVNSKFKHVTFKLFETLLNGSIEDCCTTVYDGRPYTALSCGERIFVGIDIINALCKHYDLSTPVFIDNYESFTMENELTCQHIDLVADIKQRKLKVTVKEMEAVK